MTCRVCDNPGTPLVRAGVHVSRRVFAAGDLLCETCRAVTDDLSPSPDPSPSFAVAESLACALGVIVEIEHVFTPWLGANAPWWAFADVLEASGDTEEAACARLVPMLQHEIDRRERRTAGVDA